MPEQIQQQLIVEVGAGAGQSAAFHLGRGRNIVGVDGDREACAALRRRFENAIAAGRMRVLNRAPSGYSGFPAAGAQSVGPAVLGIHWPDLQLAVGTPRHLTVGRAADDVGFLASMLEGDSLPATIAVSRVEAETVDILDRLGFRSFRFINADLPQASSAPASDGGLPEHGWLDAGAAADLVRMVAAVVAHGIIMPAPSLVCHATMATRS